MAEKRYNKDYSGKTAEEWLSERKWTGFLLNLPVKKTKQRFKITNANDGLLIRSTASLLSGKDDCDRRFTVEVDFDLRFVDITVTKKWA